MANHKTLEQPQPTGKSGAGTAGSMREQRKRRLAGWILFLSAFVILLGTAQIISGTFGAAKVEMGQKKAPTR